MAEFRSKSTRRTGDEEEDPEFQIAPMIDVLLVLLIFFMSITTTDVLRKAGEIELPIANNGKQKDRDRTRGEAVINVEWDQRARQARILLDQVTIPNPEMLTPQIESRRLTYEKINPNGRYRVLVRADRGVMYRDLRSIMGACANAGVNNITYSVKHDLSQESGG